MKKWWNIILPEEIQSVKSLQPNEMQMVKHFLQLLLKSKLKFQKQLQTNLISSLRARNVYQICEINSQTGKKTIIRRITEINSHTGKKTIFRRIITTNDQDSKNQRSQIGRITNNLSRKRF